MSDWLLPALAFYALGVVFVLDITKSDDLLFSGILALLWPLSIPVALLRAWQKRRRGDA